MCNVVNDPRAIDCPCSTCIVKSMCKRMCADYDNFWNAEFIKERQNCIANMNVQDVTYGKTR